MTPSNLTASLKASIPPKGQNQPQHGVKQAVGKTSALLMCCFWGTLLILELSLAIWLLRSLLPQQEPTQSTIKDNQNSLVRKTGNPLN